MKVDKEIWRERMGNLMARRKGGKPDNAHSPKAVSNYKRCFEICRLGNSVLDVGCGDRNVKEFCPGEYLGIDAYPADDSVIKAEIETFDTEKRFDSIIVFQVLDGLYDLKKAIDNMKLLCTGNIIIQTGFDILADQYHTFEITEKLLNDLMEDGDWFIQTYREELSPKVFLVEYKRKCATT